MRLLEIHIEAEDVDQAATIYTHLLNPVKVEHWKKGIKALTLADGTGFGIWPKGVRGIHGGRGGSHVHFAYQIEHAEYHQYVTKIEEAGLEPLHHDWGDGDRSVYFIDQDGNQGEFMTCSWLD